MADSNKKYTSVLSDGTDEFTIKDSEAVKAVKVGSSGSAITPTNGTVTIPTYEEGADVTDAENVKAALGTNSTHENKFLRKDGTWQTTPDTHHDGSVAADSGYALTKVQVSSNGTWSKEQISIPTKISLSLNNVDNTSDATKKSNFTGSIQSGDTGFVTGGDAYTALAGKADKATTLNGYGITDAYTKTEVNGLVDSPHQNYVTVDAFANLPATGSKDTIYRVANYDGSLSQVDDTKYSEYAWDGTQYVFLCVKSQIGEVFDISVYNNNAKYADLAAALGSNGANVPSTLRKGGMSVKYVQSSDSKYVQYRLISDEWSADTDDWAITDEGVYVENPEWISVTTDLEGKILEGINAKGEKIFGKIPPQIKELIRCGKLIIAASNSKYKQFANIICTGEHDQDVINECINNPDVKSIYFLDGTYLIDAPILPKSGLYIEAHNDSLFTTIDMVEVTLTEEVSSGNTLKLSSVTGFHPGMLLYVADDSGDFDSGKSWWMSPKIISINKDNNTITVSGNVPRTFPIGTVVKSASPCFIIDHISNVTINGVNIDWNVANNPRQKYNPLYLQEGIQIAYSEYVTVKNCKIKNGGRRGICTIDSKYYQIINNYFDNWHEHSIDLYWDNYYPYDGYENLNPPMTFGVVSGNICLNNQMSGIQCHRGSGCTIIGNTIKNCPHGGIRNQEYAHHNAIIGNVIEGCGAGLFLGGHDITANGNVIKDCDFGVNIGEFSDRVIVDGNNIQNSQNSAIIFSSARFCRVANNIITNSCLAITASSSSDLDVSVVSITRIESSVYDTTNHHNQVIGNTFIEESRELLPKYIFKNPEDNTKNVVVRNLCIIDGTIERPFDCTASDVVKDNDITT